MQTPSRQQHPFWDIVPLEFVACALMVAVVLLAPLRAADSWVNAEILTLIGNRSAPRSVIVVTVPERFVSSCGTVIPELLEHGKATGALLIPPVADLCHLTTSQLGGRPFVTLAAETLHRPSNSAVVGFLPRPVDLRAFEALGLHQPTWVAPRSFRAVPSTSLADLQQGRVPYEVLNGRVAVVALRDDFRDDARLDGPLAIRIGAALAGALEDRPRTAARPIYYGIATAVIGLALAFVSRRRNPRDSVRKLAYWGLGMTLTAASIAGAFGFGVLIPVPSLALALTVFFGFVHLPGYIAGRRADLNASEILAQARLVGSKATHELSDEEFWNRLAKRIEHSHPNDGVLVAELPPFAWRLHVYPNGDLSEAIIRERRRDVRRFPYSDDNGKRSIRIHRGYLVMADVPTVLVPLEVQGEPEGYIFLVGKTAEAAFLARPELTNQLADGIATLVRHRRLEKLRADDWRRPGGVLVNNPNDRASDIIAGARAALDRLELFKQMVVSAPVGLLYADSFGDVRLMSQNIANWLSAFGLQVPSLAENGSLESGILALTDVLDVLSNEAGETAPSIEELSDTGTSFDVPMPGLTAEDTPTRSLLFVVKRFTQGGSPGFVASMVEVDRESDSLPRNVERFPERGDPLVVFSLAETVQDLAAAIAPRTHGNIKLQTPRVLGHVVAHRQELLGALEAFLVEASEASGAPGPTLTLKERPHRVELTILDLRLGAPPAALKRTLLAPSEPPPGLGALGSLTRAVENSHGSLSVRNEEGWGTQLIATFVRAHPRVVSRPSPDTAVRLPLNRQVRK